MSDDNKDITNQINSFVTNPKVSGYLSKTVKAVAGMAILGCILLWVAITALSAIITNALPH
jgi:hypothetical protein